MEGEQGKKRKLDVVEEGDEEEESEEAKMDQFYELIRISKDIRARMMMISGERLKLEEERTKKKKGIISDEGKRGSVGGGAWNPTFQLEDFMEDDGLRVILSRRPSSRMNNPNGGTAGPSNSKKGDDDGDDDDGEKGGGGGDHNDLDLNLSL